MFSALEAAARAKLARAVEVVRLAVATQRPTRLVEVGNHQVEVPNAERAAALVGLAERIRRELQR